MGIAAESIRVGVWPGGAVSMFPAHALAAAAPGNAIVDFQNGARLPPVVLDCGDPPGTVTGKVVIRSVSFPVVL